MEINNGQSPSVPARTTVSSFLGGTFPMPRNPHELDSLRQHSDSDGCSFTAAELEAMGVRVPADAAGHRFVIAMSDLCAYPAPRSRQLDYVWVGGSAWDRG